MREILFRGKTNEGKWIEGQFLHFNASVGNRELAVIVEGCEWDNSNEWFNLGKRAKVIPKTVGQYTGVTDRNGKKIFEGDIVYEYNALAKKSAEKYVVTWEDIFVRWSIAECKGMYGSEHIAYYEVIGNIHDNPELLKGDLI